MRSPYFDNAKVILIFFVVLGHLIEINKGILGEHVYWLLYSFHMPAFIFIAGYFSKKESWELTFKKAIGLYLIPYIVFQGAYNYINFLWLDKPIVDNLLIPNYALWFLLSMACWKIALQLVIRFKWSLVLFVALFATHRFWLDGLLDNVYFLGIKRTISFSLFFFVGYFAKTQKQVFEKITPTTWIHRMIGSIGLILLMALYKLGIVNISVDWFSGILSVDNLLDNYSMWYLMGYQVYVFGFSLVMVLIFLLLVPTAEYKWSTLGNYTLSVYLLHPIVHHYIVKEDLSFSYDTIGHIIAGIALTVFVVYALSQPIFTRFIDFLSNLIQPTKK